MSEVVAVSCEAYGVLKMIVNFLSGIEPAHLSSGQTVPHFTDVKNT